MYNTESGVSLKIYYDSILFLAISWKLKIWRNIEKWTTNVYFITLPLKEYNKSNGGTIVLNER